MVLPDKCHLDAIEHLIQSVEAARGYLHLRCAASHAYIALARYGTIGLGGLPGAPSYVPVLPGQAHQLALAALAFAT